MEEWSPFRAYGPKYGAFCSANVITFLLLGSGAIWYYLQARHLPAYKWNWPALGEFIVLQSPDGNWKPGLLLQGLFTTIRVGFWTFLVSFFLGLMFGIYAVKISFFKKFALSIFYQPCKKHSAHNYHFLRLFFNRQCRSTDKTHGCHS